MAPYTVSMNSVLCLWKLHWHGSRSFLCLKIVATLWLGLLMTLPVGFVSSMMWA